MTPAVALIDFATRYKLRTGKLPAAMPVTIAEASLFHRPPAGNSSSSIVSVPQFMGIDLYPCPDAIQRRRSLR